MKNLFDIVTWDLCQYVWRYIQPKRNFAKTILTTCDTLTFSVLLSVWYIHGGLQMCAHAWGSQSRGCWLYFPNSVLLPWDRLSHWTRSSHFCLGKLADELSASAPSFSMLGLQAGGATLSSFLRLCWGFELRSSWWQGNRLSPLSNLPSPYFLFLFIKNKFISWWISGSISGLPPTGWKPQLCAEEFVRVDGKKRHFTLIRSNLPSCLWRKV